MKIGNDGKICEIDDHIPTKEEIAESVANTPPELVEQWRKEYTEIAKKLGIQMKFD